MLTKYYLISNATNDLWYLEDHIDDMANRWTHDIEVAFRFISYEDAYAELSVHEFPYTLLKITEVILNG